MTHAEVGLLRVGGVGIAGDGGAGGRADGFTPDAASLVVVFAAGYGDEVVTLTILSLDEFLGLESLSWGGGGV